MVGESWSLGDARTWAIANEIKLSVNYRETNDHDPDTIIKQSKTTTDVVKSGDTLEVLVAKEKKEVTPTPPSDNTKPDDSGNNNEQQTDENKTTE